MIARYRSLIGSLTLALACVCLLGACGASHDAPDAVRRGTEPAKPAPLKKRTDATLILDFTPNAVHAGIYRALAAGYYRAQRIDLRVVQPTSTQETLKLIDAGRAQFGLADGSDVASLIADGGDAQAVMALVQRPLGGLIALAGEHLRSPGDLAGKSVGVTGVPSDEAVLDTELRHAGVEAKQVRVVNVGFNGAQALVAGRVAAFTGFIPDDGVALGLSGHPITAFALDRNGGPPYPGLVAFTTRKLLSEDPALVRDFVAATVHGYRDTLSRPERSLDDLLAANPSLARKLTRASLNEYLPLFAAGQASSFGALNAANIRAMSAWMLGADLIEKPVSPERYGTDAYLP